MATILNILKRFLEHRHLPAILAIGAILVMLPALKTGLILDDLPQRAVELKPGQLPPRMHETGNPADSGSFSTVLRDLFFNRNPQDMALMKNYGMLPWWTSDKLRLGLWRPVTAFTHWLDYRLFPDSPMLMHAHSIAWFAAIVFLITIVYRKLMGTGWAAGLAALLFLLDGNTYFPVMFIANRGFMLSLFFGLLCFMNIINGVPQSPVPDACYPRCSSRFPFSRTKAELPRSPSFSRMPWCSSRVLFATGR